MNNPSVISVGYEVSPAPEQEKMQLLYRISKAMAAVKDGRELLKIIVAETQPVFGFYDIGLAVLDKSGAFYVDWSVFYAEINPSEANIAIREMLHYKFPIDEPLIKYGYARAAEEQKPFISNLTAEFAAEFMYFSQLQIEIEHGYKQFLVTTLKFGGETFGLLTFNSQRENHFDDCDFDLFQAIADLVAVAVANIQANEEIIERAREKSLLLSISNDIATIRNKQDLLQLIIEKIKPIFNFYDCGIFVFDREKQKLEDLTVSMPQISPSEANYLLSQKISATFDYHGSVWEQGFDMMRPAGKPIIVNYKNNEISGWNEYAQTSVIAQLGYEDTLMTILTTGGEELGVFAINSLEKNIFSENQFSLFQNIANQMAVAVANILANEEIIEQKKKIEGFNVQLQAQNEYLIEEVEEVYNFEEMIGQNPKFQEVCNNIGLVSKTDSSVLILGETGTGKELVARAIHNLSPRHKKALIKINCAALPAHLIESELFGHERGAFTGAIERRIGKFELAHQSTLFLDEVGELPLELQAKLLRALQEKEIERLGSNKIIQCDVRIIAATNRDLLKAVQQGHFRQDLYYRLHVFPILLPPLRERKEDIPVLATHFLKRYTKKIGNLIQGFHHTAMEEMMAYEWHGNVRELEHVIERAVIMSKGKLISDLQLPRAAHAVTHHNPQDFIIKTFQEQERDYLLQVLRHCNGKVKGTGGAAELLDLPPTTLISKMQKLGIKRKYQVEEERNGK